MLFTVRIIHNTLWEKELLVMFAHSRKVPITFVKPVHMYKLGYKWTHFRSISYWRLPLKSAEKLETLSQSDMET